MCFPSNPRSCGSPPSMASTASPPIRTARVVLPLESWFSWEPFVDADGEELLLPHDTGALEPEVNQSNQSRLAQSPAVV
ncbi:hypothetical protein ACP70R_036711 [Stipagrostis hirtigluma subsp. patula]